MPTVFDEKFRALATRLVSKFGVSTGVYTSITGGTYNKDTLKVESKTSSAVALSMSPPIRYILEEIDGDTIQSDDFKIYIAAPDFDTALPGLTPSPKDVIEVNLLKLKVINIYPIYSGEQVAAYKLQVRKGHA